MVTQSIGRHRVRAAVTIGVVALATAVVLATTGRTSATRAFILAELERPAARLVRIVDQDGNAELQPSAVERVGRLSGVEWVIGLGPVGSLAANTGLADKLGTGGAGSPVGSRLVWGSVSGPAVQAENGRPADSGEGIVGSRARRLLAMPAGSGTVADESLGLVAIIGSRTFITPLEDLNGYVLVSAGAHRAPVQELVLLADSVARADQLERAAPAVAGSVDERSLRVEREDSLGDLRDALSSQVTDLDQAVLWGTLGAATVLVAINVFGAIAERRREYGLRRTQGASRSLIAALVLLEVGSLSLIGTGVGALSGSALVAIQIGSLPDLPLAVAVALTIGAAAALGCIPAAIVAAYREPLYALR